MSTPKNDGTEWFVLNRGFTTLPILALPVPNNGVILALNNSAIYLPFTALDGDPDTGYHLKSTILASAQTTTPIDTSPPKKDETCS